MKRTTVAVIAMVLLAGAAPAAMAAGQESSAYAGSTVSFDADSNALLDYSVGETTVAESIRVQSRSEARSALDLDGSVDLGAVVNLTGAALSVESSADASATVTSESGATMTAHDNGHGSLVVASGDQAQYVEVGLGADASASAESDSRVVVTSGDDTRTTFLATGDGSVTVNEGGNVSADVDEGERLVVRSYTESRSEADRRTEQLIADGTAAASVYLDGESENVVNYDDDVAVSVTEEAQGSVSMTVERSASEGKVVVTSVAQDTFESAEDVRVSVNGSAAVRASSYSELRAATDGGDTSKYMVESSSQASASADVLVGINHFSTREVTMSDGGDGTSDGSGGATGTTSGNGPGFGALAAVVAIGASVAVLVHRRD